MFRLISRQFSGYIEHNSSCCQQSCQKFLVNRACHVKVFGGVCNQNSQNNSLSKPGRSVIMHCGILFKIPYCYKSTLLVSSLLMQSLFVLLPRNNKTKRNFVTRRTGISIMHHNNGIKCSARVKSTPFSSKGQTPNPIFFIRFGWKFDFWQVLHITRSSCAMQFSASFLI